MKKNVKKIQVIAFLIFVTNILFAQDNIYFGYKGIIFKYTMVNKIDEDATIMGSEHSLKTGKQIILGYNLSNHFAFETGIGTSKSESSFSFPAIYGTLEPYDGLTYTMNYIDIPAILKFHTAYKNEFVVFSGLGLLYKNIHKADISNKDFSSEGYETVDRYRRHNIGLDYELGFEFPIAPEKLVLGFSYEYHYIFNDIEDKGQMDNDGSLVWDIPLYSIGTSHGPTKLKGYGFTFSLIYYFSEH